MKHYSINKQTSFQFGEQFAFPHIYIYTIYIYNMCIYIYILCKDNRVYIRIIYTYIQYYV